MLVDFSNFKTVANANVKEGNRVPKGQSFNFKFKRFDVREKDKATGELVKTGEETSFTISNKLFAELGLDSSGLIQIISPEGKTYLAVVDNEHATVLKKTAKGEKGKKFKSTIIEKALHEQGVIDVNLNGVTQKLDLIKVEGSEGASIGGKVVAVGGVFEVVKGEALTAEEQAEDIDEAVQAPAQESAQTDEAAPSVDEAPAIEAPASDDDDF